MRLPTDGRAFYEGNRIGRRRTMVHVFLEKWIHERKPMSFSLLRLLEITGLFCGVIFMIITELILLPLLLHANPHPTHALLLLITTTIMSVVLSCGTVFLHSPFWRFFCVGSQLLIVSRAFYDLLTLGFSTIVVQGFVGNNMVLGTIISLALLWGLRLLWEAMLDLKVQQIPGIYAVGKFAADEHFSGKFNDSPESFFASMRTNNELCVITEGKIFLRNCPLHDELLLFEFVNSNVNGSPHRLFSKVLSSLDRMNIPYFSLTTFEKNYVLFKSSSLAMAKHSWQSVGIKVIIHE